MLRSSSYTIQLPKNNAAHQKFLYLFVIFSHPFFNMSKKIINLVAILQRIKTFFLRHMVSLDRKGISLLHQKHFKLRFEREIPSGKLARGQMCTIGQLHEKLTIKVEVVSLYSSYAWHLCVWGDWVSVSSQNLIYNVFVYIYVQRTLCASTSKLDNTEGLSSHAMDPVGIKKCVSVLDVALRQRKYSKSRNCKHCKYSKGC